ncbi:hypothetical protein JCM8202_000386 [Rhodotorula sphaerocarpa]
MQATHGQTTGTSDPYGTSTTVGTTHPSTTDKVAAAVPGTRQHEEKQELREGRTPATGGPAGHIGSEPVGHSAYGSGQTTTGATGPMGTHAGAAPAGTTGSEFGRGPAAHPAGTTGEPVVVAHEGAPMGSHETGHHHGGNHGHHGDHGHHGGDHGHHGGNGAHHGDGHHHTGAEHTKPSMGDKIGGKIDVMMGKATHNQGKVAQGEIKQTEGKAGVERAGLTGTGAGTTTAV